MKSILLSVLSLLMIQQTHACTIFSKLAIDSGMREVIESNGHQIVDEEKDAQLTIENKVRDRDGVLANHSYNELHLNNSSLQNIKTIKIWSCNAPKDSYCTPAMSRQRYERLLKRKLNRLTHEIEQFCKN